MATHLRVRLPVHRLLLVAINCMLTQQVRARRGCYSPAAIDDCAIAPGGRRRRTVGCSPVGPTRGAASVRGFLRNGAQRCRQVLCRSRHRRHFSPPRPPHSSRLRIETLVTRRGHEAFVATLLRRSRHRTSARVRPSNRRQSARVVVMRPLEESRFSRCSRSSSNSWERT